MSDFQRKLFKFIRKYQNETEIMPHFKYDETTYLAPEVTQEIVILYQQVAFLHDELEKEKDYSRLLKRENVEMQEELEYYYNDDSSGDNDVEDNIDKGEYLS